MGAKVFTCDNCGLAEIDILEYGQHLKDRHPEALEPYIKMAEIEREKKRS